MSKKTRAERNFKFETLQLHVGQEKPDPVTGARAVPRCPKCMECCKTQAPERYEVDDGHYVYCHLYDKERREQQK